MTRTGIIRLISIISALFIVPLLYSHGSSGKNTSESSVKYQLPEPSLEISSVLFEEAVYRRRSVRNFTEEPLTLKEAGQLLWAAGGATVDGVSGPTRSYASAGGLYPVEIYLAAGNVSGVEPGIYRYNWKTHSIEGIIAGDKRKELSDASLRQRFIETAPASIIFTAVPDRSSARYGTRGEVKYVPMDTGASVQTAHLQAAALGLGSVVIGAFQDSQVLQVLGVSSDEVPMAVLPVGKTR